MTDNRVRVRFAPSPTGFLHIGGLRTALFNYLFAKKHGGDFILRIEDTDQDRFVPGSAEYIYNALKWCGIEPNEGYKVDFDKVERGYGDCGPYVQSNRKNIYDAYIEKLLLRGYAYYAFDTKEELDAKRAEREKLKKSFAYDSWTRMTMKNSLTMSEDEVKLMIDSGAPYVIRFKMPKGETIKFNDIIRGEITVNSDKVDDKVLIKSDGFPSYHLANVVDDHLMGISHVIRGEEWLPSAPLHVMLYRAFGWAHTQPEFAHLPLIMGPDGKKLSKRDLAKLGFPACPLEYLDEDGNTQKGFKESGYLPEALLNIIALLGWHPDGNREIMSIEEMVEYFDLYKVGKSSARFDAKKAANISMMHIKNADNERLARELLPIILDNVGDDEACYTSPQYIAAACGLLKERCRTIHDLWESGKFFFKWTGKHEYLPELMDETASTFLDLFTGKYLVAIAGEMHRLNLTTTEKDLVSKMIAIEDGCRHIADAETLDEKLKLSFSDAIVDSGIDPRDAGRVLRAAVCDNKVGPSIFDVIKLLGLDVTFRRLLSSRLYFKETSLDLNNDFQENT